MESPLSPQISDSEKPTPTPTPWAVHKLNPLVIVQSENQSQLAIVPAHDRKDNEQRITDVGFIVHVVNFYKALIVAADHLGSCAVITCAFCRACRDVVQQAKVRP